MVDLAERPFDLEERDMATILTTEERRSRHPFGSAEDRGEKEGPTVLGRVTVELSHTCVGRKEFEIDYGCAAKSASPDPAESSKVMVVEAMQEERMDRALIVVAESEGRSANQKPRTLFANLVRDRYQTTSNWGLRKAGLSKSVRWLRGTLSLDCSTFELTWKLLL